MKSEKLIWIFAIALLVALAIPVSLAAQDNQQSKDAKFITFDVPGAGTGAGQGTQAYNVNPARAITGMYIDSSGVYHGFVGTPGNFTTFDAPGAGTGAGQGTASDAINPKGAIAGSYYDSSNVGHGFLRAPDGTITTIDVKGAGKGYGQGTENEWPEGINPKGAITGPYVDSGGVYHGYIRYPDGKFTKFDVKGAGGTNVYGGINSAGYTSGYYMDAKGSHGFLRDPKGNITTFDVKGAGGTTSTTIDSKHAIAGFYNGGHGFLRHPDGKITKFDAPKAGPGGTWAYSSNPAGAITGYYVDTSGVDHGFLRLP